MRRKIRKGVPPGTACNAWFQGFFYAPAISPAIHRDMVPFSLWFYVPVVALHVVSALW